MFFDELEAADRHIRLARNGPMNKRGQLMDAYREQCDPVVSVSVDADFEALHESRAEKGIERFNRGRYWVSA